MTVEVVNVIGDFDINLPADGDFLNEGDDHIRNVKKGVLGSFTGKMDVPITTTDDQFNFSNTLTSDIQAQFDAITSQLSTLVGIPIGGIIEYNGAFINIPANFQLCDGTNGTPDMTDNFVMGTNIELELNDAGGTADSVNISHDHDADHGHTASSNQVPDHTHDFGKSNNNTQSGVLSVYATGDASTDTETTSAAGAFTPTITVDNAVFKTSTDGVSGTGLNIPPFIKLAYIRRMT